MAEFLILVTRPDPQATEFVDLLATHGVPAAALPLVQIEPAQLDTAMAAQCEELCRGTFTWIVFTSANGVRAFTDLLGQAGVSEISTSIKLAAQGQKTADAVHEFMGRKPDFLPARAVSEDFAAELLPLITTQDSLLLVTARGTRGVIEAQCIAAGRSISVLYSHAARQRPVEPATVEALLSGKRGVIVFFSPSAVRAFADRVDLSSYLVATIGPVTTAAVAKTGATVALEAPEASAEQFAIALAVFYRQQLPAEA